MSFFRIRALAPSAVIASVALLALPATAQDTKPDLSEYTEDTILCANLAQQSPPPKVDDRIRACTRALAANVNPSHTAGLHQQRGELYSSIGQHLDALADFDAAMRMGRTDANAYIQRCFSNKALGHLDRALADCNAAIIMDDQRAQYYSLRGDIYMAMGDLKKAQSNYDVAINYDQWSGLYVARARVYALQNLLKTANADLFEAILLDPKNAEAYSMRAEVYRLTGEPEKALENADTAIRLSPKWSTPYVTRSQVKALQGDYDGAVTDIRKAISLNAKDFDAQLFLGALHEHKGEMADAIAQYDKALSLRPGDANALLRRGIVYYGQENYEAALEDLSKVIKAQPDNEAAYDYRGGVYFRQDEYDKGIADYTQAMRIAPQAFSHVQNRGTLYLRKGMPTEAVRDLEKAIELGSTTALPDLSEAHIASEDLRAALKDLDKLTQMSPDKEYVWRVRGNVQRYLGDERLVIADYERAVEISPTVANKMLLWRAQARTGDQMAALKAFDAEFDKEPADAAAYNLRCWYLTLLGASERALVYCDRALALEPDMYDALDSRGFAYHALGRHEEALRDYDHALKVEPEGWSTYLRRSRLLEKMGASREKISADYQRASNGFGKDKRDQYFSHLETQDALLNTARLMEGKE